MKYYCHPTSEIGSNAIIGENTVIWQYCTIMENVSIGRNCKFGQNVFVESGVVIGNYVTVKNNVALYKGVICESGVFFGPNCVFTNVKTPRSFISRKEEIENTIIRKGATIGANATVVCGCEIGKYAMIGAGTVVITDIEPYNLVVGNPAKRIGYVCKCGSKLKSKDNNLYICNRCGQEYICKEDKISCKRKDECFISEISEE